MDYANPALADALAAEYVTGTLRGGARRRFETLLPGHPALRMAVHDWQARLMPMTVVVTPQPPPAAVWTGIQSRLWPAAAQPAAARLPVAARSRDTDAGWWRQLRLWRTASAFSTLVAVGLAVLVTAPPPSQPPVVVVLQSTAEGKALASIVASVSADGRALVARPLQNVSLEAGRVLELWAVPPDGQGGPTSLGLIRAEGTTVVRWDRLPSALLKGGTAALAVSVEPPGGSTTGAPTGPVVFAGKLQL